MIYGDFLNYSAMYHLCKFTLPETAYPEKLVDYWYKGKYPLGSWRFQFATWVLGCGMDAYKYFNPY